VLEVHGKIAGYATLGANRSRTLRVRGEIYELYIEPAYQGLGFGRRLFQCGSRAAGVARLGPFVVWALEDNAQATAFYRALGGEPVAHGVEPSAQPSHPFATASVVAAQKQPCTWRGNVASLPSFGEPGRHADVGWHVLFDLWPLALLLKASMRRR
jgi:N-acetylglutamate synthase-like GNAT family acetyltransferase